MLTQPKKEQIGLPHLWSSHVQTKNETVSSLFFNVFRPIMMISKDNRIDLYSGIYIRYNAHQTDTVDYTKFVVNLTKTL